MKVDIQALRKLISDGGNDVPKEELAIAYMNPLVGAEHYPASFAV